MKRIIMDTNILFAGLYSADGGSNKILRLIDDEIIKPVISPTLLFEYEEVLKRNIEQLEFSEYEIDIILDNICVLSEHQTIYFLWRPCLKDPKDDLVLEVAVASKTDVIVTHNLKDFKNVDKFGIRAMTPKTFLEEKSWEH